MKIDFKKLVISVMVPLAVGLAGSALTIPEIMGWYRGLNKPTLVPPDGVFGPVWTTLYVLMGLALYLVWISKKKDKRGAFLVFGLQLLLNFFWSLIFFRWHSPGLAVVEVAILWLVILMNINVFYRYSKAAGRLLVPYLVWVSFAAYLNFAVWRLN